MRHPIYVYVSIYLSLNQFLSFLFSLSLSLSIYIYIYHSKEYVAWFMGWYMPIYSPISDITLIWKLNRQHEFKSWTRLLVVHFTLILFRNYPVSHSARTGRFYHIYIILPYSVWIYISSSCRVASTDIPDSLSLLLPIVHRLWQVYPHITAEYMFLLLPGHMWGSIGVHHLWARPCFSSSVLHVWFV